MITNSYIRPKSVIHDGLAVRFPDVRFVETYDALHAMGTNFDDDIDYLIDVDYLGYVGKKAFGIHVKPITDRAIMGNYAVSARMKASFSSFTADFAGNVFIVFSLNGQIANQKIIGEIADEIVRLQA